MTDGSLFLIQAIHVQETYLCIVRIFALVFSVSSFFNV